MTDSKYENNFQNNPFTLLNNKNVQNYNSGSSNPSQQISIRRKLHQVLAENYQIKQKMMKAQTQYNNLREQNLDLKQQIQRINAQGQVKDIAIKKYKEIAERVEYLIQENSKLKELVNDHQNENQMLTKIKEKYAQDLKKLKQQMRTLLVQIRGRQDADRQVSQNVYRANRQMQQLLNQIKKLQLQKQQYSSQIFQFEAMMIDADSRIQKLMDNQQILRNQIQKYKIKSDKYKRKALDYRKQRNQMYEQLQRAHIQVGNLKFKKYFPEQDNLQFF